MRTLIQILLLVFITSPLCAQLQLPAIVGDNMVLQRDKELRIWGWADPGSDVNLTFAGSDYETTTNASGEWELRMPAREAGGPYSMTITSGEESITLENILVGEVWLFSGQSNMVHYLDLHKERYAEEIKKADYTDIRQFLVPQNPVLTGPAEKLPPASWKEARGEDLLRFSVVGYFFAKAIHEEYDIPVGFINASVGGTPIEAWTSEEGLQEFPDLAGRIKENKDTAWVRSVNQHAGEVRRAYQNDLPEDQGLEASVPWFMPEANDADWRKINVPGYWEDQGVRDLNGIVWYRKEIMVSRAMAGKEVRVKLGRIVDADRLYVNGELVGQTYYQYPQRRYTIPAGLLKQGKNTLAVRIVNNGGKGGFIPDKPYYMVRGSDTLDLKGYWNYKVGAVYPDGPRVHSISLQNQPSALYNGMVAPYAGYPVRGICWYQGESNTWNPDKYARLQPALISDWREKWKDPELPFLYVQLPNFMEVNYSPSESNWAAFREAQRQSLEVSNTGMATAIDLGEWNDIHPGNKQPVGERLALLARSIAYGEDILAYGPQLNSTEIGDNSIILNFKNTGSGLVTDNGGNPQWFSVAGRDKEFQWAQARIDGESVILEQLPDDPVYVRYAWADNPAGGLLFNKEGLPASPFETTIGNPNAARDSIYQLTRDDHQQMMAQLGIDEMRPGPSGNPNASNAANSDESKVKSYELPDPLVMQNGKKVKNESAWENNRRPELVELFDREVYGRVPENVPSVAWQVLSEKDTMIGNYQAVEKMLLGVVDNSAHPEISVEIELQLVVPRNEDGPVPVIMEFGFIRWPWGPPPSSDNSILSSGEPAWKQQVLSRGWGYAILVPGSIQADNGAGLREGIIGLVNKGEYRKPDDWGSLRAWAWGASRALDYLETDEDVNSGKVAIEGLSRYGKAALVAMAYEPRFSLGFIGSSGAGGAKILRRNFGEQVENLTGSGEYHWFAGNFLRYGSEKTADDLPVDAHELIAMCAPRPVFISVGSPHVEGNWIDARGMYVAAAEAGEVYELYGKKGLNTAAYPPLGQPVTSGEIAFRQHAGGHSTGPNWSTFLAWACRYWGDCKL